MSASRPPSFPQPLTVLVGRETEIDLLAERLRHAGGSILTLVGPAGVGKTRLALAVAERIAPELEHGAVYVDLAPLSDARLVVPTILARLGLTEGERPVGQLASYLANRELLLMLDNFEQVLEAGPSLNASLAGAPGVRVVVTSQTPLRVRGEQEYVVEPLAVPAPGAALADVSQLAGAPAVRLFELRAQAVRPAFQLTESNLPVIAEICRYLDGVPLAIELAAARSNVLSPEALLARLSGSLHLLRGGPRDAPGRHQALQAAIEWSYGLLAPAQALLLDRLSVFAGNFSLPAAEAIAGNAPIVFDSSYYVDIGAVRIPDDGQLSGDDVLELVEELVDHSLVQRIETGDSEPRFRLFQTIRQFAAERLTERADGDRTALRHATWYRALAESAWNMQGIPRLEREWLDALDNDAENVRSALDYLTNADPAAANTMAASLVWYFYIRGRRMEGIRAIEGTLGRFDPASISPEAAARTEFAYGNLLSLFPQTRQQGIEHLQSVLAKLQALGNDWGAGYTYMALGVLAEDAGDYPRALEYAALARPLLELVDDAPTMANVDFHIAVANFGLGNLDEARRLALGVATAPPERAGLNIAYALHLLGMIAMADGNRVEAAGHFRAALDFSAQHGVVATATELLDSTATLLADGEEFDLVARLFGAADRLNQESGNPITLPERAYYDAARDRAGAALGSAAFQERYAAGEKLSLDVALALARTELVGIESGNADAGARQSASTPATTLGLTTRELEVLRLVALGMSDREIGDTLFISHGTARTHVRNILGKLEVHSRTSATSIALREGLVDLSETG